MTEHNYIIINNVKVILHERHFYPIRARALLFLKTISKN